METFKKFFCSKWFPVLGAIVVPLLYLLSIFVFANYNPIIFSPLYLFFSFISAIDQFLRSTIESHLMHATLLIFAWIVSGYLVFFLVQRIFLLNTSIFKKICIVLILWVITLIPWLITKQIPSNGSLSKNPQQIHVITGEIVEYQGSSYGIGFRRINENDSPKQVPVSDQYRSD